MPARKPQGLKARHDTKDEIEQREAAEAAMTPDRSLPMSAPAKLDGHEVAAATWRRLMRIYGELKAQLVSLLDMDLLIHYCIVSEQVVELDAMRTASFKLWADLQRAYEKLPPEIDFDIKLSFIGKLQQAQNDIRSLDARCDQKRRLLHQFEQSLYLTPRSRAGVLPEGKDKEPPKDALEQLLDEE